MHFFGKLKQTSAIHRDWRTRNRVSGHISGVLFRWDIKSQCYVSDELSQEAFDLFRLRQDQAILLETLRVLPEVLQQDHIPVLAEQQVEGDEARQQQVKDQSLKSAVKPRRAPRRRLAE